LIQRRSQVGVSSKKYRVVRRSQKLPRESGRGKARRGSGGERREREGGEGGGGEEGNYPLCGIDQPQRYNQNGLGQHTDGQNNGDPNVFDSPGRKTAKEGRRGGRGERGEEGEGGRGKGGGVENILCVPSINPRVIIKMDWANIQTVKITATLTYLIPLFSITPTLPSPIWRTRRWLLMAV
jgi:hypothetical protein